MSDAIIFALLFATYVVMAPNHAGGPTGKDVFDLSRTFAETMLLLCSSITFGFSTVAVRLGNQRVALTWLAVTFVLGAAFVALEISEFTGMYEQGAGPQRSGFLSAFFTLVGTHGLHVSMGLVWIVIMSIQVLLKGLTRAGRLPPVPARPVLAFPRHRLDRHLLDRLPAGSSLMQTSDRSAMDRAESLQQPYLKGFVLALLLTGIPFGLVAASLLPPFTTLVVIAVLAVVQVVVHLRYFLHIDLQSTPRENLLALGFAAVLIFLMVGGTLWIMLDLNARMMG